MSDRKIKRFEEFMRSSKIRKFMDHMVVEGKYKSWFLGKSKSFELHIYHTPIKKTIVEMKTYPDMDINELKLTFKIGDNINLVRDWVEKNKYEITVEITKFN